MDIDVKGLWAIAAMIIFVALLVLLPHLFDTSRSQRKEKINNMKMRLKFITLAWLVNLMVFTTILWLGHYALHTGIDWIKTPCEVTLLSTGIAKVILSTLVLIALFSKD